VMARFPRRPLIALALTLVLWVTPAAALGAALNSTIIAIANPSPAPDASFGLAVASISDVNGDGTADFGAGAPGADRAYFLSGADRTVMRTITDPENQPGNNFGFSLASVGDVDGDGVADVAVGARGLDNVIPIPCPIDPCVTPAYQGRA